MPRLARNTGLEHKYENVPNEKSFTRGDFHLGFMADKGRKGHHLVLVT